MKKIFVLALSFLLLFALVLTGCAPAAQEQVEADAMLIGVSMPTMELQRWNQDGQNLKQMLEAEGFEVDLQYAENKVDLQISQLENMITLGADVLVIAAIDGAALGSVLEEAAAEGIRVIAYDRLIMDTPNVDYYATFDNFQVGVLQGEFIVDALGLGANAGPFNLEVFAGSPDDNNAFFFRDGAFSVLQEHIDAGTLVINSGQTEMEQIAIPGWKPEGAQNRMDNLLTAYYADRNIDVILSPNDSLAQGIVASLRAAGYGSADKPFPVLTGQDCDIINVKMMIAGEQSMSVFKDTRVLAAQVVDMIIAIRDGAEVPVNDTTTYDNRVKVVPTNLSEPIVVTTENYEEVLIEGGYYTREQIGQ
jgi:putative multiple sugar transport system substrate-binding protein